MIPKNNASKGGRTTCFSMIKDGKESAVTDIMNASAVPNPTPRATKASAIGNVPKMSAYMGTPIKTARRTDHP